MQKIATALIAVAALAEGAYLVKLSGTVARLTERSGAAASGPSAPDAHPADPSSTSPARSLAPASRSGAGERMQPPVFAATARPGPAVLEALASPEGRVKLQEALTALKEQRRTDKLIQASDRREQLDQRLREIVGPELSLSPEETRKVHEILGRTGDQRRRAVQELQGGLKSRGDAKTEIDAAHRTGDEALKAAIGEKRLALLRDLRKREDRAQRAAPGSPPPALGGAPAGAPPAL
jgi:hypothetical protein